MAAFNVDYSGLDELSQAMEKYGDESIKIITEVLHNEGAKEIQDKIRNLLPASGRRWKGKKAPARSVNPFTQTNGVLEVTVKSTGAYGYLYFPDDGSNTQRHAGNQQFMKKGAEDATGRIIDLCLGKLTEKL